MSGIPDVVLWPYKKNLLPEIVCIFSINIFSTFVPLLRKYLLSVFIRYSLMCGSLLEPQGLFSEVRGHLFPSIWLREVLQVKRVDSEGRDPCLSSEEAVLGWCQETKGSKSDCRGPGRAVGSAGENCAVVSGTAQQGFTPTGRLF